MIIIRFNVGDYVTRSSYDNDILFKITNISNDVAYLKGVNVRLATRLTHYKLDVKTFDQVKEAGINIL